MATLPGTDGGDVITAGVADDVLIGRAGDDKLSGGDGNDLLIGSLGLDAMTGGKGNDVYIVDDGGDVVTEDLDAGVDRVEAYADYQLIANVEDLTLLSTGDTAGTGNDTYFIASTDDKVTEKANEGTDTIITLFDMDLSVDGANVENLDFSQGDTGRHGIGNALNNMITGTETNDTLDGGAGNDVLIGGLGADVLIGGVGSDVFLYAIDANAKGTIVNLGGDTIADFKSGQDKIDVSDLFTDFGLSHKGNPFADGHLALVSDGHGNTLVQFDADGAGGNAAVTLATVVNSTVAQADIVI